MVVVEQTSALLCHVVMSRMPSHFCRVLYMQQARRFEGEWYTFWGNSLLSLPADDKIPTQLSRPSPAPDTSNDGPNNTTSKVSESSASCGSLVSLAGPGLALGSALLASRSNEPPSNWSCPIASFAQLVIPPGTR